MDTILTIILVVALIGFIAWLWTSTRRRVYNARYHDGPSQYQENLKQPGHYEEMPPPTQE